MKPTPSLLALSAFHCLLRYLRHAESKAQMIRRYTALPSRVGAWSAISLRLIVGYGFMAHGYAKLAKGPGHFIGILQALHVPMPDILGWATILIELVGGFAVLVGAFIPLVSLPMAVVLIVAALTVHLPNGFSSIKIQAVTSAGAQFGQPGYEISLLYLACLMALVLGGAGPLSVDRALFGKVPTPDAARTARNDAARTTLAARNSSSSGSL